MSSPAQKELDVCYLCEQPIKPNDAVNLHHIIPESDGGTDILPVHYDCHVDHHSTEGDFERWGRKGGFVTASRKWWIFNLKIGKEKANPRKREVISCFR